MGALDTTNSSSTPPGSPCCAAAPATTARSSRPCWREYDIQINKTSRNSVLVQININNTRSDMAHLIKALADMARGIEQRLADGGQDAQTAFKARVKSLVEDVPDLPNFSASTTPSATTPRARPRKGTCARPTTWPTTPPREHVKLQQQGDRRAAGEGPRAGLGQVRDPLSARLPDHGARAGGHDGDHHVHAQAGREGDPRLQRRKGLELVKPTRKKAKK